MKKRFYLFMTVAVILIFGGCASILKANKPVYPTIDKDAEYSILRLDNRISYSLVSDTPFIQLEVDGFSPTPGLYIPKGITELRIPPGTHQITHKGEAMKSSIYYYKPVSSSFNTEKGKTYTISFTFLSETMVRFGYKIDYEGWNDEEISQWPGKNIIANPLW